MIVNKFSVLLAKRLLKISIIAQEAGISRPVLSNLYYRRSKQIDLQTLDKLCRYLHCNVNDIFEYQEADQEIKKKQSENSLAATDCF